MRLAHGNLTAHGFPPAAHEPHSRRGDRRHRRLRRGARHRGRDRRQRPRVGRRRQPASL